MPDACRLGSKVKSAVRALLLAALLPLHLAAQPAGIASKPVPPQPSSSFSFAWLSDTHVGSLTGEEDLRASVRDINSQTGLSFVVISGDITEYGSLAQLRLAK